MNEWVYRPFDSPPCWVLDTNDLSIGIESDEEGFHVEAWCPLSQNMVASESFLTLRDAKEFANTCVEVSS